MLHLHLSLFSQIVFQYEEESIFEKNCTQYGFSSSICSIGNTPGPVPVDYKGTVTHVQLDRYACKYHNEERLYVKTNK